MKRGTIRIQKISSTSAIDTSDWQVTRRNALEKLRYIHDTKTFADCSFLVGTDHNKQNFEAHKMWLAMASPVFETMFYGTLAEKDTIKIVDIQPDAFRSLIQYIYTDDITFTNLDQACGVCYAAKKYMLPHLVERCITYLSSENYPQHFCKAYEFGKLLGNIKLMETCLNYIRRNTLKVLKDASFKQADLDTVIAIFEQDSLAINSEMDLLLSLEEYSKVNPNDETNKTAGKPSIRDALKQIRFLTLRPDEFATFAETTNLLTPDDKVSIFINICSPQLKHHMQEGFSLSKQSRGSRSGYNQQYWHTQNRGAY